MLDATVEHGHRVRAVFTDLLNWLNRNLSRLYWAFLVAGLAVAIMDILSR